MECTWCKLPIQKHIHLFLTFPLCDHHMHEECWETAKRIHHISACIGCNRDRIPILDLGDDAITHRMSKLLKFENRNNDILQRDVYKPSEIRVHCQEMFKAHMDSIARKRNQERSVPSSTTTGYGLLSIFSGKRQEEDQAQRPSSNGSISSTLTTDANIAFNPHEVNWKRAHEFAMKYHPVDEFRENDISVVTLYDSGVTIQTMRNTGYTLRELHELKFTWKHLVLMDLRWDDLSDPCKYSAQDLRNLFNVTYKTIVDFASGKGESSLGVQRFCELLYSYDEMLILEMTDIKFLIDLGLTRGVFYRLARSLTLDDMIKLKVTAQHFEDFDLLNLSSWKVMSFGDPSIAAEKLNIPLGRVPEKSKAKRGAAPTIKDKTEDTEKASSSKTSNEAHVESNFPQDERHDRIGSQRTKTMTDEFISEEDNIDRTIATLYKRLGRSVH